MPRATHAIRQTLYDKLLEEMGLLGAGQRSMNNKDPAYRSTPGPEDVLQDVFNTPTS
jgi:hypothetical protein